MRIGCMLVPQLPLAAFLRTEPLGKEIPLAMIQKEGAGTFVVVAVNSQAKQSGIVVGMTAVQASSLCPEVMLRSASAAMVSPRMQALRPRSVLASSALRARW